MKKEEKMSMSKLKKNFPIIKILLSKLRNKKTEEEFKHLINCLGDQTVDFIAECVRNALRPDFINNLPSDNRNKLIKKITPHKKVIKKVISKKCKNSRKKIYIQKGGGWFLPLLSVLIPAITGLITK